MNARNIMTLLEEGLWIGIDTDTDADEDDDEVLTIETIHSTTASSEPPPARPATPDIKIDTPNLPPPTPSLVTSHTLREIHQLLLTHGIQHTTLMLEISHKTLSVHLKPFTTCLTLMQQSIDTAEKTYPNYDSAVLTKKRVPTLAVLHQALLYYKIQAKAEEALGLPQKSLHLHVENYNFTIGYLRHSTPEEMKKKYDGYDKSLSAKDSALRQYTIAEIHDVILAHPNDLRNASAAFSIFPNVLSKFLSRLNLSMELLSGMDKATAQSVIAGYNFLPSPPRKILTCTLIEVNNAFHNELSVENVCAKFGVQAKKLNAHLKKKYGITLPEVKKLNPQQAQAIETNQSKIPWAHTTFQPATPNSDSDWDDVPLTQVSKRLKR